MPQGKSNAGVEIVGVLVWSASAVSVFGYTWSAYKSTYHKFPGMGGSFGDSTQNQLSDAGASASPGAESVLRKLGIGSNNAFFKAIRRIANLSIGGTRIGDPLGLTSTSTSSYTVPNLTAMVAAVRAGNREQATALYTNAVKKLNNMPSFDGHGDIGVAINLRQQGVYKEFSRLTGIKVEGF